MTASITRPARAALLSLCTLLPFADAPAQGVLGGRVYFGATEQPLACIGVALVSASDSLISRTRTRADGTFDLLGPASPGLYRLSFVGMGLEVIDTDTLRLDATTEFDLPFRLALTRSRGTLTSARRDQLGIELEPSPLRGGASLRYPPELLADSIEGRVIVGYAIDTVGRVDPRTTVVLESSHPAFTASVRTTLGALRYQPAQYSGAPQCIFSTQEFVFSLQGRR